MNRKVISIFLILTFALLVGLTGCHGMEGRLKVGTTNESYPQKDIAVIIPFTPGGASDVQARIVEKYFKKEFGVNMIITYKEGADGEIGFSEIAKANPDGYTIGCINIPHIVLQPLARETEFTYNDFAFIGQMVNDPQVIAVMKDSKYNTLQELLDDARANPRKITLGNVGTFSGHHIASLDLMNLTGAEFTLVPYKGSAEQIVALQGRHIQAIMGNLNDVMRELDKYKLLAISTEERHPLAPEIPTFKEQGLDLISGITRVWAAPRGIDPEILATLRKGFENIAKTPDYLEDMKQIGQPEEWLTGPEVEEQLKTEVEKATTLLKRYGLVEQK